VFVWLLERAGARFRGVGHWILVGLSLWLALSGLLAWARVDGDIVGLARALDAGAPWWSASIPLLALLSLFVLWLGAPGVYPLLSILGFGLFFISGANSMLFEDAVAGLEPAWGAIAAPWACLAYFTIALVLGIGQAVPLDAPLARLVYVERFNHLRSLYRMAKRRKWRIKGPSMPHHAVRVRGKWRERELFIESAAIYSLQGGDVLTVATSSKRILWPFFVEVGLAGIEKNAQQPTLSGTCHSARGKATPFYLLTPPDQVVHQESLRPLQQALDLGRHFLRARTQIYTVSDAIIFVRSQTMRMTESEQDIELLLQWLGELAHAMEKSGLSTRPERDDWWTWD
jgi:hypothetical protein